MNVINVGRLKDPTRHNDVNVSEKTNMLLSEYSTREGVLLRYDPTAPSQDLKEM